MAPNIKECNALVKRRLMQLCEAKNTVFTRIVFSWFDSTRGYIPGLTDQYVAGLAELAERIDDLCVREMQQVVSLTKEVLMHVLKLLKLQPKL